MLLEAKTMIAVIKKNSDQLKYGEERQPPKREEFQTAYRYANANAIYIIILSYFLAND
jgi:hypothetical protein